MSSIILPPTSSSWKPHKALALPDLPYVSTPNQSVRLGGSIPYLIVLHRPVGAYGPSIKWLCNPKSGSSAHVITEGNGTGVDVATQLVPWHKKAWSCKAFNSDSYNIEADDDAWDGDDWGAFYSAAHIAAWICHKTDIPPKWTHDPLHIPGLCRHLDLGIAGGAHKDPTSNLVLWKNFIRQVEHDVLNTGWRETWGKGTFKQFVGV